MNFVGICFDKVLVGYCMEESVNRGIKVCIMILSKFGFYWIELIRVDFDLSW